LWIARVGIRRPAIELRVANRLLELGFVPMTMPRVPAQLTVAAGLCAAAAIALAAAPPLAAQQKQAPRQAAAQPAAPKAAKQAPTTPAAKSEQAIVVLVNDEPITAYEIQQRAKFLALNANLGDRVKENFKRLVQSENTNKQLRAILEEAIRSNPGKSRDQIAAIFEEKKKQFALSLQKQAIDSTRAGLVPQFRKDAQEELIEDRLKLQEAKRLGIEVGEDEVDRVMRGLAERNKLTPEQFYQHIRSGGVEPSTMRDRFKAQFAWREVVRRRAQMTVSITQRDVDRMLSNTAIEAGEDTVELQVQKLTLLVPGKLDQGALARRLAEADGLRRKFGGCKTMAALAREASDVRFEDLKYIKPSSIAEPTRTLLLSAKDGDLLPPSTAAHGIEVYAVCGRRPIRADDKQRERIEGELAQKEYEIVAKRHLRDLRQDAHIEYR
jgi:peptidyl-prolyl cis-trans isomerase SurA